MTIQRVLPCDNMAEATDRLWARDDAEQRHYRDNVVAVSACLSFLTLLVAMPSGFANWILITSGLMAMAWALALLLEGQDINEDIPDLWKLIVVIPIMMPLFLGVKLGMTLDRAW